MGEVRSRHEAWLLQAEDDFRWGQDSCTSGHYSQACFIAQQVGEKALKALAFFRGFDLVKSHSIAQIARELDINGDLLNIATTLDLYYIAVRYPDALPDGIMPFEHFTKQLAEQAMKNARQILERVRTEMALE